jgi:hypothetical protein
MEELKNLRPVILNVENRSKTISVDVELFNFGKAYRKSVGVSSAMPGLSYSEICDLAKNEKISVKWIVIDMKKGREPLKANLIRKNIFGDSAETFLRVFKPSEEHTNIFYCKYDYDKPSTAIIEFKLGPCSYIQLCGVKIESKFTVSIYLEYKN